MYDSEKIKAGLNGQTTICWRCRNAVPEGKYGCSWSRKLEPVDGWTADRHTLKGYPSWGNTDRHITYKVFDCPLFIPDPVVDRKPEHWLAP